MNSVTDALVDTMDVHVFVVLHASVADFDDVKDTVWCLVPNIDHLLEVLRDDDGAVWFFDKPNSVDKTLLKPTEWTLWCTNMDVVCVACAPENHLVLIDKANISNCVVRGHFLNVK